MSTGHVARRSAAERLARLRWVFTGFFTFTTALCLLALVAVAATVDSRSRREALDDEVNRLATALSRGIYYDAGHRLHLEPLNGDDLVEGSTVLAVVASTVSPPTRTGSATGVRYARGSQDRLPAPAVLRRAFAAGMREKEPTLLDGRTRTGLPLRLGAAPVWDGDAVGAVVVVAGDPRPAWADHVRLLRSLMLGCGVLLLVAASAGHVLLGRWMRPVLRGFARQECFLAEAAHELRTPLATLRLVTEDGLRDQHRATIALRRSVELADRMGRITAALLNRARIQAGAQPMEHLALRLDQLVEQIAGDFPRGTAELRLDMRPTVVSGDPELLAQAVGNLIDNAIRHGAGPIDISVADGVVRVRDYGPGPSGATDATAGTGIGLSIVRWVADLHGGQVRLSDAECRGALAELRLP